MALQLTFFVQVQGVKKDLSTQPSIIEINEIMVLEKHQTRQYIEHSIRISSLHNEIYLWKK